MEKTRTEEICLSMGLRDMGLRELYLRHVDLKKIWGRRYDGRSVELDFHDELSTDNPVWEGWAIERELQQRMP